MVHMSVIEARLSQLEVRISMLFKPEIQELQRILVDGEEIVSIVPGRYFGGFALLAATDRRLLLVDKKVGALAVEDIRYDMISEVNYGSRLMDSSITLFTVNKQHRFTSVKHKLKLRELTNYVQQKVMDLRYGSPEPTISTPRLEHLSEVLHLPHYSMPMALADAPAKVKRLVGAAALHDTPWSHINPYTRTSLTVRSQWSKPLSE